MALDVSSRVIIRVWTSAENSRFPGVNVGHVSLETSNNYMSLWPMPFTKEQKRVYRAAGTLEQMYLKYFMTRDADFRTDYQQDCVSEGHVEPQVVVCLYSLDVAAIEKEFNSLTENTKGWRLIGSNQFIQALEKTTEKVSFHSKSIETEVGGKYLDNCASLVSKLLTAGGISKLVTLKTYTGFKLKTSSSIATDEILDIVTPAKIAEVKKHPETTGFLFESETPLDKLTESIEPSSSDSRFCNIM